MTVERLEGSGGSQLVQLIRRFGANTDVRIEEATVTSAPPGLKIQIDGMKVELETEDLIVAEHLTARTEIVKISDPTANSGSVTVPDGTYPVTVSPFVDDSRTIKYPDRLKVGDRVIVAESNSDRGLLYFILDKAVTY